MLERTRQFLARLIGPRKVAPEMYPEIRLVPFGNIGIRLASPEDVLKISAAWRCVTLIANTTASLDWQVMQKTAEHEAKERGGHPVSWLLSHEPNDEMGALDFRRTLATHLLLYGNGYAEIVRDAANRPKALYPIGPDRVEPQRDYDGRLYYRVSNPRGGYSDLSPRDVFHVRGIGWDGVRGYSILEVAAQSLQAANTLDGFAGMYFQNGMRPSGVIEVPREIELSAEGFRSLEKKVMERHGGAQNAGKPLILDEGMKWSPDTTDPEKAQFLDTRKFTVHEVCRWFGVPPYLAFSTDQQPRANVETQSREFYSYGLMPVILAFEQEANRKLLNSERQGHYSRMNTDQLLRGDYTTLASYYQTMRNIGAFSINDVLRKEGENTIGPEGDVRHMQAQYVPVGETAPRPGATRDETDDGAGEDADNDAGAAGSAEDSEGPDDGADR